LAEGPAPEEIVGERYRIGPSIGEGGTSAVFRSKHVTLDRPVAVKFLSRDLLSDPQAVERFRREARLVSRLRHPNIVDVLDFGETPDGQLYLVMELIDGTDLRSVIHSEGALPLARTARIVRQVASALQFAHDRGVLHRDLKSANIMLTSDGEGVEWVKVVDFGLSKPLDSVPSEVTQAGAVLGTPEYMAPEQVAGRPLDSRADLYALGVMIYEALCGSVPFGGTLGEILSAHLLQPPPGLRERRPEIPEAVEAVVFRLLSKVPEDRYGSAREAAAAFEAACAGEDAEALPAPLGPAGPPGAALPPTSLTMVLGSSSDSGRTLLSRGATPTPLPGAPAAPVPVPKSSAPPASVTARWALGIVCALAVVVLGLAALWWPGESPEGTPEPPRATRTIATADALARARHLLREGHPARASALLDAIDDSSVFCTRAPLFAAAGNGERAVIEAERCIDLEPARRGDVELARAVVRGFGGAERRRAYDLVVRELAQAARTPLLEAARHPSSLVRAGAWRAARALGLEGVFDRTSMLLLDLADARTCPARRMLMLALATLRDTRALLPLEKELSRPKGEAPCYDGSVHAAVRKLRRQAKRR
jgi:serine/threonine-protein kinase